MDLLPRYASTATTGARRTVSGTRIDRCRTTTKTTMMHAYRIIGVTDPTVDTNEKKELPAVPFEATAQRRTVSSNALRGCVDTMAPRPAKSASANAETVSNAARAGA